MAVLHPYPLSSGGVPIEDFEGRVRLSGAFSSEVFQRNADDNRRRSVVRGLNASFLRDSQTIFEEVELLKGEILDTDIISWFVSYGRGERNRFHRMQEKAEELKKRASRYIQDVTPHVPGHEEFSKPPPVSSSPSGGNNPVWKLWILIDTQMPRMVHLLRPKLTFVEKFYLEEAQAIKRWASGLAKCCEDCLGLMDVINLCLNRKIPSKLDAVLGTLISILNIENKHEEAKGNAKGKFEKEYEAKDSCNPQSDDNGRVAPVEAAATTPESAVESRLTRRDKNSDDAVLLVPTNAEDCGDRSLSFTVPKSPARTEVPMRTIAPIEKSVTLAAESKQRSEEGGKDMVSVIPSHVHGERFQTGPEQELVPHVPDLKPDSGAEPAGVSLDEVKKHPTGEQSAAETKTAESPSPVNVAAHAAPVGRRSYLDILVGEDISSASQNPRRSRCSKEQERFEDEDGCFMEEEVGSEDAMKDKPSLEASTDLVHLLLDIRLIPLIVLRQFFADMKSNPTIIRIDKNLMEGVQHYYPNDFPKDNCNCFWREVIALLTLHKERAEKKVNNFRVEFGKRHNFLELPEDDDPRSNISKDNSAYGKLAKLRHFAENYGSWGVLYYKYSELYWHANHKFHPLIDKNIEEVTSLGVSGAYVFDGWNLWEIVETFQSVSNGTFDSTEPSSLSCMIYTPLTD